MNIITVYTPLVSILIPVYKVEKYIERCARSVFEQTYENLEYIFVNDCTPDNSIQIVEQVLAEYPQRVSQVRIIDHEQNEGIAVARNSAISNATGEFVFNIDSDDYIETDTIETLVNLQEQTNADVVTGRMYINDDEIDPHYVEPFYQNKDKMLTTIVSDLWHHEMANRLVRRSLFIDHGIKALPYINIGEDWQLTAKVVYFADICVTADKYTYHYVYNPSSLVHSNTTWKRKKDELTQLNASLMSLVEFFKGTKYESMICSLFIQKESDYISRSVINNDKDFFELCRSNILAIPSKYHHRISRTKLICFKSGYYVTCIAMSFNQLRRWLLSYL